MKLERLKTVVLILLILTAIILAILIWYRMDLFQPVAWTDGAIERSLL